MNYTQNQKIEQITETTLAVGVNIGSRVHCARSFDWRCRELSKALKFYNCREKDKAVVEFGPIAHYWFV
jgi:hypothetical protein